MGCKYMLHSLSTPDGEPKELPQDPFDASASLSVALEQMTDTSFWELQLLRRHHLPAVATLAKLFLKPFFKISSQKLDPELYLDQTTEKMYKQALKSGERQIARWKVKGHKCPLSFHVEDDEHAARVLGWAAALSTSQRRVGAGV